jgi:imidazolonepropionase-like amidohydrolase
VLALINGKILLPSGRAERADVLLEGDRIREVGRAVAVPRGTPAVDASGKTIIPGLINLHSHLTFFPGAPSASDHEVSFSAASNAYRAMRAGITTVRDVGGVRHADIRLRDAIAAGLVPGPRLLVSGMFICITGGHSHHYAREADGVDGVRRAVREQVKAGADLIKFMGSGGVADATEDPEQVQFTFDELQQGVDEAHRLGRKVAVHAHPTAAIRSAILAGADFIEHATFLDEPTIELLLEREVIIVPTLCVYERIANDEARPRSLRDHAKRILDEKLGRFSLAAQAGVRWGVGLDNGTFYPPDDIAAELELIVAAGVPPSEAMRAATDGNARLLGLEDEVGSVSEGKRADLVLLDDDPTKNLGAVRSPRLVIKDGKPFPRDPLFQASQTQERKVV